MATWLSSLTRDWPLIRLMVEVARMSKPGPGRKLVNR